MKPGKSLERDVQRIYTYLLNLRDEGVIVANSVVMTGKSGVQHEIDVYYEFSRAGIRHRVAIECKDWSSPVSKGQIQEFESKLRDIGNITGVVVARRGYQSGAKDFAEYKDIIALGFDELPSFGYLMGERLRAVALPDATYVGEPFWTIMELKDGKETGSHFVYKDPDSGTWNIFLTYSKHHAERAFRDAGLDSRQWGVRGLPRFALRAFLLTLEIYEKRMNTEALLLFLPPGADPDVPFIALKASREDLMREYYGESLPSIEDAVSSRE